MEDFRSVNCLHHSSSSKWFFFFYVNRFRKCLINYVKYTMLDFTAPHRLYGSCTVVAYHKTRDVKSGKFTQTHQCYIFYCWTAGYTRKTSTVLIVHDWSMIEVCLMEHNLVLFWSLLLVNIKPQDTFTFAFILSGIFSFDTKFQYLRSFISTLSVSQEACSMLVVPRSNSAGDWLSLGMLVKH